MLKKVFVPAVCRELLFVSEHDDAVVAIEEGLLSVEPHIKELTTRVGERADAAVFELLKKLKDRVTAGTKGIFQLDWGRNPRRESWSMEGDIYSKSAKRKRRIGSLEVMIGSGELSPKKLVGSAWPAKGGREALRGFAERCHQKMSSVDLATKKYGWPRSQECVIWFDKTLTLKSQFEELGDAIEKQARQFFKIAYPLLTKIAPD